MTFLPEELRELFAQIEDDPEPLEEIKVAGMIGERIKDLRRGDPEAEPPVPLLAESLAFWFLAAYPDKQTGWKTYFGPMSILPDGAGNVTEFPSIQCVTEEVLLYWQGRAKETTHPVLKARYADLVWDFSRSVRSAGADVECAQIAIDSHVEVIERRLYEVPEWAKQRAERALQLAISINHIPSIERARDAVLKLEGDIAEDGKPGT